jgi:hypothetical protein
MSGSGFGFKTNHLTAPLVHGANERELSHGKNLANESKKRKTADMK